MSIFKRLKNYMRNEFLPGWAKDDLIRENEKLKEKIVEQSIIIKERDAYIEGLECGLKAMRRIKIINRAGDN